MRQVSVLIPTYNRADYLGFAIESALAQTIPCEIIVFDDGSTDATQELVKSFDSGQIRYVRSETCRGESVARTRLLQLARTPFSAWLDSDDWMEPDRLERQLEVIRVQGAEIVWTAIQPFERMIRGTSGRRPVEGSLPALPCPDFSRWRKLGWTGLKKNTCNATALFGSALYRYPFNPRVRLGGQDCLWTYEIFRAGHRVAASNELLYWYRIHPGQTMQRQNPPDCLRREQRIIAAEVRRIDARTSPQTREGSPVSGPRRSAVAVQEHGQRVDRSAET